MRVRLEEDPVATILLAEPPPSLSKHRNELFSMLRDTRIKVLQPGAGFAARFGRRRLLSWANWTPKAGSRLGSLRNPLMALIVSGDCLKKNRMRRWFRPNFFG
jgi:hypothetical protein